MQGKEKMVGELLDEMVLSVVAVAKKHAEAKRSIRNLMTVTRELALTVSEEGALCLDCNKNKKVSCPCKRRFAYDKFLIAFADTEKFFSE